MKVPTSLLMKI